MTEVEKLEIEKENFSFHLEKLKKQKSDVKHLHPLPILLHYYLQPSA